MCFTAVRGWICKGWIVTGRDQKCAQRWEVCVRSKPPCASGNQFQTALRWWHHCQRYPARCHELYLVRKEDTHFQGGSGSSLGSYSQESMPGWHRVCWRRGIVRAVVLGRAAGVTGVTLPTSTAHRHLEAIFTVFPAMKISKVQIGERKGYVFL